MSRHLLVLSRRSGAGQTTKIHHDATVGGEVVVELSHHRAPEYTGPMVGRLDAEMPPPFSSHTRIMTGPAYQPPTRRPFDVTAAT